METAPASGGAGKLALATARECTWAAASGAGWVVITSSTNGQGEGEISYLVAANRDPAPRQTTIEVNDSRTTITQAEADCSFNVSPRAPSIGAQGGTVAIQVEPTANCPWSASTQAGWMRIASGASGTGSGTVTLAVDPNSGAERSATAVVAAQTVTVTQITALAPPPPPPPAPGCSYAIAPTGQTVGAAGGNGTIAVTAGNSCGWTAVSNAPWITIGSGASGSGNGSVAFTVAAHNGGSRSGTISVAGHTFSISQGAASCGYSIAPTSQSMPAAGGTANIAVTTGGSCAWASASNTSWISIASGASGNGSGSVRLTVAANSGAARTGTATIAGHTFTVTQAAAPCSFALNPAVLDFSNAGGTGTTAVSAGAGCTWTAVSNASWITIASGTSGAGSGTVGVSVAANSGAARSGTVTIGGQTLTVNQQAAPCSYALSAAGQSIAPDGGTGSIGVTAAPGCAWTATSNNGDWITVTSGDSGNGNGTVAFAVTRNSTGSPRTGTLTVAGHTFTVTQDVPCSYSLSSGGQIVASTGGSGSFTVNTGAACTWTSVSSAEWLTVTAGASGTGPGTVSYSVAPNPGQARIGTLTIGGQTHTVEQSAP